MIRTAALAAGLVLGAASARGAEPLTLAAALVRAHADSPDMAAARADLDAARGRLTQAGLFPSNPTVNASGTHHRIPGATNIDNAVTVAQEVEVGGQRGLRVDAARHGVDRAERLLADRERTVDGEVRRAFAGLVAAQRRRAIDAEAATESKQLADATATRLAQGDASGLDVELARIDALKQREDATSSDVEVVRAQRRLALAIGAPPDVTFAVTATDDPRPPTPPETALVARALAARPDLAAARAERDRLDGEADVARRTGLIPNPTFRGFYSHENGEETLAGGEVEIPLPIWNRQQGTETDLRGQAAAAAADVVRLERQIPRDVGTALAHERGARATWGRYRAETLPTVDAAHASLARALAGGYLGLPEVLNQQDRLRATRRSAVDAWLALRAAEAELIEAVGEDPW